MQLGQFCQQLRKLFDDFNNTPGNTHRYDHIVYDKMLSFLTAHHSSTIEITQDHFLQFDQYVQAIETYIRKAVHDRLNADRMIQLLNGILRIMQPLYNQFLFVAPADEEMLIDAIANISLRQPQTARNFQQQFFFFHPEPPSPQVEENDVDDHFHMQL